MSSSMLAEMPQEILEHIAFTSATMSLLSPPSDLAALASTNSQFYSRLSINKNRNLYANIFTHKFDTRIAIRRIGTLKLTQPVLADELKRRFLLLKHIKLRTEASVDQCDTTKPQDRKRLRDTLFGAYLLMVENEGRNEMHLRDSGIDGWLHQYWFRHDGTSHATQALTENSWPEQDEEHSIAMWLFWFLLNPDFYKRDRGSWNILYVLKIYALGAHRYRLSSPSWTQFLPSIRPPILETTRHYCEDYHLSPPAIATPAILSLSVLTDLLDASPISSESRMRNGKKKKSTNGEEWECEWYRCSNLGYGAFKKTLSPVFIPQSVEGVWEGTFTFIEFSAYADLIRGAAPNILTKSMVSNHRQTWKLREHHLMLESDEQQDVLLSGGDPLRAYFATGTRVTETTLGVEVEEPGLAVPLVYKRASSLHIDNQVVRDIILTGEGHSAWGQFSLVGRIRPCDGFISLSKDYIDGDRGKWLYRGYLIGNSDGCLSGRWRDTMSPLDTSGYEGCFTMSRRR